MTEAHLNELSDDCEAQLAEARLQGHRHWTETLLRRRQGLLKIAAKVAARGVDEKHAKGRDER